MQSFQRSQDQKELLNQLRASFDLSEKSNEQIFSDRNKSGDTLATEIEVLLRKLQKRHVSEQEAKPNFEGEEFRSELIEKFKRKKEKILDLKESVRQLSKQLDNLESLTQTLS